MENDVPFNPVHIRQLGAFGVPKAANAITNLIQQLDGRQRWLKEVAKGAGFNYF